MSKFLVFVMLFLTFGAFNSVYADGNKGNVNVFAGVGFTKVVDESFSTAFPNEDNMLNAGLDWWFGDKSSVGVRVARVELVGKSWDVSLNLKRKLFKLNALYPYVSVGGGVQSNGLTTTSNKPTLNVGSGFEVYLLKNLGLVVDAQLVNTFDKDAANDLHRTTHLQASVGLSVTVR